MPLAIGLPGSFSHLARNRTGWLQRPGHKTNLSPDAVVFKQQHSPLQAVSLLFAV